MGQGLMRVRKKVTSSSLLRSSELGVQWIVKEATAQIDGNGVYMFMAPRYFPLG
jgi:hypothetical protein